MSSNVPNFSEESVLEVIEHVWMTSTDSDSGIALEPNKIVELIGNISTASHYFDAFLQCHKYLSEKINDHLNHKDDKSIFVTSQLKLCFHERDHQIHSCVYKILVSYFKIFKSQTTSVSIEDDNLLSKLIEFVGGFSCISQIANLLDLFTIDSFDRQQLTSLTQQLIDRNCHIQAAIVINRFDIRHHFDSNYLLTELLYEDNLIDIERYLQLETVELYQSNLSSLLSCENINNIENQQRCHFILLKYMQYLDDIFIQSDSPDLALFQRLKTTQRKQFLRKIYRYVFDLFKLPIFDLLDDNELYSICPNITKSFYNKQLSGLFYRFKDDTISISVNVMSDHINALNHLTLSSELMPQAHCQVLSVFTKRNDFSSANEYIRIHNLSSNLFSANASISQSGKELISYPLNLSLHNGIIIVENDNQFDECLTQIQQWDFISYDSEWFNNYFLLRNSTMVSLIQISHDNICYLIDCVTLAKIKPLHFYLGKIITDIINNKSIMKIGYSLHNDFQVIWKSYSNSLKQDSQSDKNLITLSPHNLLDFRELFSYLMAPSNQFRNIFDQNRLSISSHLSGISQVTFALTGYCIDKTEQLSDWSKRPFRDSQIRYATIDACCLVDCYRELERLLSAKNEISFAKFVEDFQINQANPNSECKSFTGKNKSSLANQTEIINNDPPIPISKFRCVVDDMLFGIIRYLRICNADTLTADQKDRDKSVRLALNENRIFITSGQVYERYRKHFDSPSDCVHLSNANTALEQFKELVTKCNLLIRLEDLFARCSLCNTTPFIIISREEFKSHFEQYLAQTNDTAQTTDDAISEKTIFSVQNGKNSYQIDFEQFSKMKFIHKMPQVDKFYICPNCGHIYWDGCHSSNFIHSIKSLIIDA